MLLNTDGHGNVSYTFENAELNKRRVLDYWTPERKAAAVPIDRTAGLCADGGLLAGATEPQLADLSKMPFMAGGKLFFSKDNKNYVASAELICRRNLVLTAAHCIQDKTTGHLGDNYMFERCYNDGSSAEKLTFKTVALKAYWYEQKAWKRDYAFAVLNEDSALTTPLTYSTQDVNGMVLTDYGYPSNNFSGKRMSFVEGSCRNNSDGTRIIDGDRMGPGGSGGAWLIKGSSTVVGLNSFGPGVGAVMYAGSPVFDAEFDSLYQYVISLL